MPDLVCYSNNLPALIDEAVAAGLDRWVVQDDFGDWTLAGDKTPLIGAHPEYLSLLRVADTEALSQLSNISVLGSYSDGFVAVSDEAQAIYDRLAPQGTTTVETALAGAVEVPAPDRIGGFYD